MSGCYGSKAWANLCLRAGIRELKNLNRDPGARKHEVLVIARALEENGFWWQAKTLRSHYHNFLLQLSLKADPRVRGERS